MGRGQVAVLFPGQGIFRKGHHVEGRDRHPQVREILCELDDLARRRFNFSVLDAVSGRSPSNGYGSGSTSRRALHLIIFGQSVAAYKILESRGLRAATLIGHGFGEIAALVCGGAFSLCQGAEIVCHRASTLEQLGRGCGYMATLKTAPGPTERIVELVGTHRAAVAVENCNSQTVVSGTVQGMERVKDVAHAVGIHFQKLNSHYPHYCPPIMHPLRETLAARLCYLPSQPLQVPVFSPVMQRYYESVERFTDCLAEHFTRRLKFASAVHRVCDQGIRTFVECGPLYGLCDIVNALLKERPSDGFACVHPEIGDRIETQISIQSLEMLVA